MLPKCSPVSVEGRKAQGEHLLGNKCLSLSLVPAGDQCLNVWSQTVTTATSLTVIPMVAFVGGWVLLWRQQVGRVGDTSLAWELAPHHLVSCSASHSAFTGTIYSKHWPSVSQKPTARTSPHIPALCKRFSPHNPQRRLSSIRMRGLCSVGFDQVRTCF